MTRLCTILAVTLAGAQANAQQAKVLEVQNIVQTQNGAAAAWKPAVVDQQLKVSERIRTRQRSRATVRLTDLYTLRMEQFTTIEITPQLVGGGKPHLNFSGGKLFIFSRELGGEIDIKTPAANGALRGTQLLVKVDDAGRTFYQALEGSIEISNAQGSLTILAGQAAEAVPGKAPVRTAKLEVNSILQWALYYPAVLDPLELEAAFGGGQGDAAPGAASKALAAYQEGDMLRALELQQADQPKNAPNRCMHAQLLLAVGRVDEALAMLADVPKSNGMRRSLERLIAAVTYEEQSDWPTNNVTTASEALADSYYLQSRFRLDEALAAARRATQLSPRNGYAMVRLAELKFSFGLAKEAEKTLAQSLEIMPRNAQAHALRGFVLSARNHITEARQSFQKAVALDGALGNGWLGLGLTKIKQGDVSGGRADIQTATTVEPLGSLFHSYLGKAMSVDGRQEEAIKDLSLAKQLDPQDPTPWLYSAIENQLHNRTNEAIEDLNESIRLNENRRVYRSQFLLDQDRAMRSANLAKIYLNNGMNAVAFREASRAVQSDYMSASAHLFLANAFNSMRDPKRIQLRNETAWFNELLLSNMLSPVGGGPLSQYVSQQEYSKLLEADGIGASVANEYRSTGEFRTSASVFGTHGNVSYGLDYYMRRAPGTRFNNNSDLQELHGQIKWQPTPDDILYFQGKWAGQRDGDTFDTYNNQPLAPGMSFKEDQRPGLLLAGWNHRWTPGSNTLFLAGWLNGGQTLSDPQSNQLLIQRDTTGMNPGLISNVGGFDVFTNPALAGSASVASDGVSQVYSPALQQAIAPYIGTGNVVGVFNAPFTFLTRRRWEIFTAELQHIQQMKKHTLLAGARFQAGSFTTDAQMSIIRPTFIGGFATPAVDQHSVTGFQRLSLYAYDFWQPAPWFTVIGGVSWDHIIHPDNFRNPPVNDRQRRDERLSGKAGMIFNPSRWFQIRGAYTQGIGGVTYDESVRLEPVQIAGFNQSYRTIISESLAGSVETPRFESWGLSLEGRLPTRTWWGVTGNVIRQDVNRTIGAFTGYDSGVFPISPAYFASSTSQSLAYIEQSLQATLNQLVGSQFAIGTTYRVARSELCTTYNDLIDFGVPGAVVGDKATLHELGFSVNWNSPTGLFATAESNFYKQSLHDDPRGMAPGALPRKGDEFVQFNVFAGYRFNRNLCEVSAGFLNLTDQNYQLSPLSPYYDIARQRTFVVRFRMSF